MAEDPMTLQEIGDVFGISRERVRQIQVRITKKIKTYLQTEIEGIEDLYSELL
jgi:RNA polymerase sigma-32 factor